MTQRTSGSSSDPIVVVDPTSNPEEQFEMIETIGKGSFGAVYLARHRPSSQLVAVKKMVIVERDDVDEINQEVAIMSQCKSRFIVTYYGSCWNQAGREIWLVMEYCSGGAVSNIINKIKRSMTEMEIGIIVEAALMALDYLHSSGKIHRDIKPDNILINSKGHPKLADFGVTGELSGNKQKMETVIGTPFFMAPEIILNTDGYNAKVDIWALGISVLEMADQKIPYHDCNPMRAVYLISHEPPPTLKDESAWSPEFVDFTRSCLFKDPDQRADSQTLLKHPFVIKYKDQESNSLLPLLEEFQEAVRIRRELKSSPLSKSADDILDSTPASPQSSRHIRPVSSSKDIKLTKEQRKAQKEMDKQAVKAQFDDLGRRKQSLLDEKQKKEQEQHSIHIEKAKIKEEFNCVYAEKYTVALKKQEFEDKRENIRKARRLRQEKEEELRRKEDEERRRREKIEEELRAKEDLEESSGRSEEEAIKKKSDTLAERSAELTASDAKLQESMMVVLADLGKLQSMIDEISTMENKMKSQESEEKEKEREERRKRRDERKKREQQLGEELVEQQLKTIQQKEEERLRKEREMMANNMAPSPVVRKPEKEISSPVQGNPPGSPNSLNAPPNPFPSNGASVASKVTSPTPSLSPVIDLSNLPTGWTCAKDPKTGRQYFIDHNNRSTHWKLPPSIVEYMDQQAKKKSAKKEQT
eukprot:TRINITY_DN101_c0_g2_i1.p1 TRINITY_DN101_c0_g2~~TRINITY_DN101_c0_g2_i1.p1  ORF type:complete len:699 (-),score=259.91 TRINITY_DN101_c0_g2_i1:16-2112(-)